MESDKGAVLYTGPDGIGDFQVVVKDQFHIGVGTASTETTLGADYICRGFPGQPFPINRSKAVGEVGWEASKIPKEKHSDAVNRMKLLEFRQAAEDRYTHRYQNPFFEESTPPGIGTRITTVTPPQEKPSPVREPIHKVLTINVPDNLSTISSTSTLP